MYQLQCWIPVPVFAPSGHNEEISALMDENILLQKQVNALRREKWPTQLACEYITHLLQWELMDEKWHPSLMKKKKCLSTKNFCDAFKPFHDMDFVDEETDCEYEVQLPTAMETESSKRKMPAESSTSKEFTRKIIKKAFSIEKKNSSTFSDSKIKAMESQSMAWGNVCKCLACKKGEG
ncbi:hypothetical protein M9H77_35783 [Catharanthus roseus]|uniref:Uncharacterized protein n=1 Tax=Catharanthus roseus TaxID=4058 RepID=A0ACB9ZRW5_CATRO|nr:hypothetical protein M9H77_35783 [Catharanthus roseus]